MAEIRISRPVTTWTSVLLAFFLLARVGALHAATGLEYLASQQQLDGHFGGSPTSLATEFQSTAEAIRAYQHLAATASPQYSVALTYINGSIGENTEYLARQIVVNVAAGNDVAGLSNALLSNQNSDGGFGDQLGYASSVLDTSFALEALASANYISGPVPAAAVGFLFGKQLANGGFSDGVNEASIYVTAQAIRALTPYRSSFNGVSTAISNAQTFLLSRRSNGTWGENFLTSIAILAIAPATSDVSIISDSVAALKSAQVADGSWDEDSYTTALALMALRAYESRIGGGPAPADSTVSGYVVRAGSTEAIASAIVSISERGGIAVLTNGDGYFAISGLPAGSYTVTATKAGYSVATKAVATTANQVALAGTFVLDVVSTGGFANGFVFNAVDATPIAGATVSLSGPAIHTVSTGSDGRFALGPLAPATYSVTISRDGFSTVNGSAAIVGGQTLVISQGLVKAGGFVDDTSGSLSGIVVDAKTAQPIGGATLDLGGGLSTISGANGLFTIPNVPRGNYTGTLSAAGYVAQTLSISYPAGSLGNLGVLALYPAASNVPPTSLTLSGTVVDGISGTPIAGATINIPDTGASTTSVGDGRFLISDIGITSFTLVATASGYQTATLSVTASGFGEANITVAMSPPGSGATTSSLLGTVSNANSGAPVSGAVVKIEGTSLTATTDGVGAYTLGGIDQLGFTVAVTAVGYQSASQRITLASHGNYNLNPVLQPVVPTSFQVISVAPDQAAYGANETALIRTEIASVLTASKSALVIGDVVDADGVSLATLTPYAEGTTLPASSFDFAAGETKVLTIPWPTAQLAPGTYRVIVRVVEPGTINRAQPLGDVLAENNGWASIVSTTGISGAMAIDPPLTQAGATTPVNLVALIRNSGNVPITAGNYQLTIQREDNGQQLYSTQGVADLIAVSTFQSVSFGSWVPTDSGNLRVSVRSLASGVPGEINGRLYVGDKASGKFSVDKSVVPEGTQTVRGTIHMEGVDTRTGTGTDPLFALVKDAVRRGGAYTAPNATAWHRTNRCLGCHIQTQSTFGLASSLDKAAIDRDATKFLFNAIASSQQADGALRISHPEFAKTQTQLAVWALTSWPDKSEAFRILQKASKFNYDRRSLSGNQTFWSPDHATGWWNNNVSATALALSGMAELVNVASTLDLTQIRDYSLSVPIAAGAATGPLDMEIGPDGALYVAKYSGAVNRIDLGTGQVTTQVSGLPNQTYGLTFGQDGLMYVSGTGFVRRVNTDGTTQVIYATSATPLTDIDLGPDGLLYVADYNNHRILRVVPASGQTEIWVTGGLLRNPYGLRFDGSGNLLVANYGGYNILQIAPDKTVTIYADGLASQPRYLDFAADGDLFVSTGNIAGISRIRPNRVADRLVVGGGDPHGVLISGGRIFVSNYAGNVLYELLSAPLDTTVLDTFQNELPRIANFFLSNYQDNSGDNVTQAMRMIAFGYLREVITDAAQRAQFDTAITYANNLLRSRQRADGGWGRNINQASDPLVSAMVGIAIDYTQPSADDPQVRKIIQYLLNTQAADGSWGNVNNGLTTRLASTSFVMAYLPKALDRLGGIDVDLHVDMPADIALANPTIVPTATLPSVDGGTEYIWHLTGVTTNGRDIGFDLTLQNMQLGESRPAARKTYMEFDNSFTAEKIQVALEIPAIRAASDMVLGVGTDRQNYQASEPVTITSTVTNTGPTVGVGQVELVIRAPGSTTNIAGLPAIPVLGLASGGTILLPSLWNTGATLAGAYEVYGRLYDSQHRLLSEATAPFNIGAPAVTVTTGVTTDKPIYQAWDLAAIDGRVTNVSPNTILPPSRVELTVKSPTGETLFFEVRTLGELMPGRIVDLPYTLKLVDAAAGQYPVDLVLKDDFTRTVLSTSQTSFRVERHEVQGLVGTVTVSAPRVYVGDPEACTETAKNASSTALTGVKLIHQLISADTTTVINEVTETVDLSSGGVVHNYFRNVDTRALGLGSFVCATKAEINGDTRTLAFGGFQVVEPPIKIDLTMKPGGKGRLLVLLDAKSSCEVGKDESAKTKSSSSSSSSGGCEGGPDPHGTGTAPELAAQQAFLEKLLTDNGWSYTITTKAADFTRELRSGNYNTYALMNEQEKLAEQVQKELREAVFRGEGLLVAGSHDMRLNNLPEALGVKYIGTVADAVGTEYLGNDLNLTGRIALLNDDKPLRVKKLTATSIAVYTLGNPGRGKDPDDCRATPGSKDDECNGDPNRYLDAIFTNNYGKGKSALAVFDLLATATRDSDQSLSAKSILKLLEHVAPKPGTYYAGSVVPITLTITNQGIATPATVLVTLPNGVTGLAAQQGEVAGPTVAFNIAMLQANESLTRTFWVKLPNDASPVEFTAVTMVLTLPTPISQTSLTLNVEAALTPQEGVDELKGLLTPGYAYKKPVEQAISNLEKAASAKDEAKAVDWVLKATDDLLGINDATVTNARAKLGYWLKRHTVGLPLNPGGQ